MYGAKNIIYYNYLFYFDNSRLLIWLLSKEKKEKFGFLARRKDHSSTIILWVILHDIAFELGVPKVVGIIEGIILIYLGLRGIVAKSRLWKTQIRPSQLDNTGIFILIGVIWTIRFFWQKMN